MCGVGVRGGREGKEWEGEGGVGGQSEEKALQVVYMNVLVGLYLCCTVSEGQYFEPRVCCITNWCSLVRI